MLVGNMPSVEEAGRVLQSSLAQGYSMSQTIPGQRLHAVMEHGWHVRGTNGSQSRMEWTDTEHGWTLAHARTPSQGGGHGRAAAARCRILQKSSCDSQTCSCSDAAPQMWLTNTNDGRQQEQFKALMNLLYKVNELKKMIINRIWTKVTSARLETDGTTVQDYHVGWGSLG